MNYPKIFCDIAENQNLKFSEKLSFKYAINIISKIFL